MLQQRISCCILTGDCGQGAGILACACLHGRPVYGWHDKHTSCTQRPDCVEGIANALCISSSRAAVTDSMSDNSAWAAPLRPPPHSQRLRVCEQILWWRSFPSQALKIWLASSMSPTSWCNFCMRVSLNRFASTLQGVILLSPAVDVPRTFVLKIMAAVQGFIVRVAPGIRIVPQPVIPNVTLNPEEVWCSSCFWRCSFGDYVKRSVKEFYCIFAFSVYPLKTVHFMSSRLDTLVSSSYIFHTKKIVEHAAI